jgi:hypothetical protein
MRARLHGFGFQQKELDGLLEIYMAACYWNSMGLCLVPKLCLADLGPAQHLWSLTGSSSLWTPEAASCV